MTPYIVKRLFSSLIALGGVFFAAFILFRAIPGNPVENIIGERSSPEIAAYYTQQLNLDKGPLYQFLSYGKMLCTGNLGISYFSQRPVWDLIKEKFPNTAYLAGWALLFSLIISIPAGALSSLSPKPWIRNMTTAAYVTGISIPVYWLGMLLVVVFVAKARIIPGIGMGDGSFGYVLLPALTLGLKSCVYNTRILSSSIQQYSKRPFVEALRARGAGRARTAAHITANAALPFITAVSLDLGSLLSGSVLTETIFAWDGIGRLTLDAIYKRDYPIILGVIFLCAVIFIAINLAADILYCVIDPRIRYDKT